MRRWFALLGASSLLGALGPAAAQAEPITGSGQTYSTPQMQRELDYGTGTGKSDSNNIFNTANPIDLMNKLRRITALDDATSPADAVDAALKGFDAPATPPLKAGSAQVKAP